MKKIKEFFAEELRGWKPLEAAWLALATAVILGLSLYWKDNWVSITAALTGVWCVILTGKGKVSSFVFGVINVLFYAWIAFQVPYYGEVMLNDTWHLAMGWAQTVLAVVLLWLFGKCIRRSSDG